MTAVTTVITKSHLAYARVLAASLHEHHPELPLLVVLADEPQGRFDPAAEPYDIVALADLGIPGLDAIRASAAPFEVATLAKPFALAHALDRGHDAALFLDPDTLVTGDLTELLDRTARHAAVLTPHLLAPLESADRARRDLNIIVSGADNAGVVGARARNFLRWWQARVVADCRHAPDEGVFYDQRWLDLAPGLFGDVHVHRDPAINVGHWDLPERTEGDGAPEPRLVHFSGFDPTTPEVLSWHAGRLAVGEPQRLAPLAARYAQALRAAGHDECRTWPYAFG
jgi:hypothetical protein